MYHIKKSSLIWVLSSLVLLSACVSKPDVDDSNWYVRSEFTWWEARKEFVLKPTDEVSIREVEFDLTPDGSAFHLKFADRLWSVDKNCGAPAATKRNLVRIGQWHPLDCNYQGEKIMPLDHSYKFLPAQSSRYRIEVKFINSRPTAFKIEPTEN